MNEKKLAADVKRISVVAGKKVMSYFGKAKIQYQKKNAQDFVTQADLASNNIIIGFIKKNYPDHGIISEEEKGYHRDAEYVWIIDPLEGTRNFSVGNKQFSIMIAIMRKDRIIMGAIYNPYFKELFFAREGFGTTMNTKKIGCAKTDKVTRSISGFSVLVTKKNSPKIEKLIAAQKKLDYWVTNEGCAGFTSQLVANGQRDWFCQPGAGGVWDFAAPYLILKESGCKVTNLSGKEWTITDTEMLAANPILHRQLVNILNA